MRIIVTGQKCEQIYEPEISEYAEVLRRVQLSVELWNRDRPKNQRKVIEAEVWPPAKS